MGFSRALGHHGATLRRQQGLAFALRCFLIAIASEGRRRRMPWLLRLARIEGLQESIDLAEQIFGTFGGGGEPETVASEGHDARQLFLKLSKLPAYCPFANRVLLRRECI